MIHKLEADSIQLNFGERRILSDVYLKCETGKITGLLGRNGQGKTCLMDIIYGTLKTENKSIRVDDVSLSPAFKTPVLLSYLPQFNFIPGSFTLKRIFSDFDIFYPDFEMYFPDFESKSELSLKNLSGGERRMVEVYVIIKSKSLFSLLDEPFTHLMPIQIEKVKEILQTEKDNKGFLITDHIYRDIIDICDEIYVLSDGKLHLTKDFSDIEALGYATL
jgi:ABC-type multidrug transport system ATPase subunit